MDQGIAAIVAAIIVVCLTIIDNNKRKQDELFFKALDFLKGGIQERNLGIAAIGLSLKSKRHQSLCISLLIGSAIYLIRESKHKDAEHEKNNLFRIMNLLLMEKSKNLAKKNIFLMEDYKRLVHIIDKEKEKVRTEMHGVQGQLEKLQESNQHIFEVEKGLKQPAEIKLKKKLEKLMDRFESLIFWTKNLENGVH